MERVSLLVLKLITRVLHGRYFHEKFESHKYILTNLSELRDVNPNFLFVHKCIMIHRRRVSENWTEEGGVNRRMQEIA